MDNFWKYVVSDDCKHEEEKNDQPTNIEYAW
jgi:hypothetical protein